VFKAGDEYVNISLFDIMCIKKRVIHYEGSFGWILIKIKILTSDPQSFQCAC
jgi:hypothetical protein